jgi:hypothetical protein
LDEAGEADREGVTAPKRQELKLMALLLRRDVIAVLGVLAGLGVGVVLGRETAPNESAVSQSAKPARGKSRGAPEDGDSKGRESPDEDIPTQEYRRHLGRHLPRDDRAQGFAPIGVNSRRVAQIKNKDASLRFAIDPAPGDYVLSTIVYLGESKAGTLRLQLDGQALNALALSEGWNMYASPLPRALLDKPNHELTFTVDGVSETAVVGVDSVAVIPSSDEANFSLGAQGVGNLIDGFSKPSGESAWSDGPTSTLGVVLAPAEVDYRLTVRAGALSRLAPMTVSARVNGKDVGTAAFSKKTAASTWSIPAKTLVQGVNRIEFLYPATAKPVDYNPKSRDKRALALRVYGVSLQPAK